MDAMAGEVCPGSMPIGSGSKESPSPPPLSLPRHMQEESERTEGIRIRVRTRAIHPADPAHETARRSRRCRNPPASRCRRASARLGSGSTRPSDGPPGGSRSRPGGLPPPTQRSSGDLYAGEANATRRRWPARSRASWARVRCTRPSREARDACTGVSSTRTETLPVGVSSATSNTSSRMANRPHFRSMVLAWVERVRSCRRRPQPSAAVKTQRKSSGVIRGAKPIWRAGRGTRSRPGRSARPSWPGPGRSGRRTRSRSTDCAWRDGSARGRRGRWPAPR